ncbi:EGF-like domain protein, partial [Ostertagia ostertagi]
PTNLVLNCRKGGRYGYENKLVKVEKYVKACCEGYYQTKDNVCKPECEPPCKKGRCVAPNVCECDSGYGGKHCTSTCSVGYVGLHCQRKCECDNGANCDPETGACICGPGFTGIKCEKLCPPDRYGPNCTEKCLCQNGGRCDRNGKCECLDGFAGEFCLRKCDEGKFGANCKFECNCKNGATCDAVNGRCICAAGFSGPTCEDRCALGFFGKNCSKLCDCLNNNKCDSVTGKCLCVGWMGEKCERGCPKGFLRPYGEPQFFIICWLQCSKKCELCNGISWTDSNAACDPVTGACKCERGYKGPDCKQRVCDEDMYGGGAQNSACLWENGMKVLPIRSSRDCANKCECDYNVTSECEPTSGRCVCLPGRTGAKCADDCPDGHFGLDCAFKCQCGENGVCDKRDGSCKCRNGKSQ